MITQDEIKEAATKHQDTCAPGIVSLREYDFAKGAEWAMQRIMDKASEGFEEWLDSQEEWLPQFEGHIDELEQAWQAAQVSAEKEIQNLRERLEKKNWLESYSELEKKLAEKEAQIEVLKKAVERIYEATSSFVSTDAMIREIVRLCKTVLKEVGVNGAKL